MNGLDHVAILVSDLDGAIALFRDVYGLALSEVEEVPTEKVKVAIFGHGAGRIELVSPTGPDSPMAKARKVLNIPAAYKLVAMMPLGYAETRPVREPPRKRYEEIVSMNRAPRD